MTGAFHKQQTEPHLTTENQPVPEKIGPYKIETLLNKGGMSWLYLGIDPKTKKPLAIKTLPTAHLKNAEITERFIKEAKMIALTNHPNIVKLYGEGTWDKGFYIAMEWVHGISLRQFLTEHSFSLRRSLEIILQVAYALDHLHLHGVIHRDLKPENILIEESGKIKVIDFGIAQLAEESPEYKSGPVGTPSYMSPEQKEDPSKVTFASDIYSLGVIAYELITGKPSFGMIQLSFLPKTLRSILEKMLAVSISERYQTISEVIQDLSSYLDSEEFDKEKPEQDQLKEVLETFQKASNELSPFPAPAWSFADIGIARTQSASFFGLYYDIFKVSADHCLLWIASPVKQGLDPLFDAATLRGILRSFMLRQTDKAFKPSTLIQFLNEHIELDPSLRNFALSYLYLDAATNQLTFFGAGFSSLIHASAGGKARVLHNQHPLLSDETLTEFSETLDNWNIGDTLVFHSLIPDSLRKEKTELMELELSQTTEEALLLSAQPQAEHILKSSKAHALLAASKDSQVVLTIQRIG